jgi:lysyl-tRNA synthetase class I
MLADETALRVVETHVKNQEANYLALQNSVKLFFDTYSSRRDNFGKIYRLYSRGEKQNGSEFKDNRKILQKLAPGMQVHDVPDIIGITVVCPFTRDREEVLRLLESQSFKRTFKIRDRKLHKLAYQASHYIYGCFPVPFCLLRIPKECLYACKYGRDYAYST